MVKIDRITNMIEQPDVWLCHRNYDKICKLSYIDDLKIYVTANAVDEVAFSLHKYNNGVEFEYWEQLKDLKIVLVDGFGYFEIAVDKQVSDDTKKVITGISTEAELGQITIDGLEINGEIDRNDDNNWDNYGKYIPTVLYNETDTSHSLLHRLLSKAPHWKLDNIADIITDNNEPVSTSLIYRTFNFDGTNIYDALQEIAAEFDVVFRFNTVSRSINMYDLNTIGEDTTVHVSTQNLATDFTCTSNKDSIKNCFKIVGGDDNINAAIRAVNPNGSNYIYHPSPEQMEDMSEGLRTKLTNYEEYFESLKTEYNECCNDLYNAIDDYYNLKTSMMPNKASDEETDIDKEIAKLTSSKIGNIPVQSLTTLYETGAEKAILTIAQVIVDYRYEVTINSGLYDTTTHTWTGKFKVTNTSNSTDVVISANDVVLTFVEDEKEYLQDKIDELVKDVNVEDVNIEKFKENLTYYALDSLEQFVSIYAECTKVLEKYSYKDKVEEEFYELYYSYWEKWQACISERDIRKEQVATAEKNVEKYQEHVDTYHEMLDFEHFMGDYYKEFCLYRREDTYQNDNYISDGLDNSNTLQNAKKLVEVATKELIKASLFQTTYTANLNNLFTNPIYKPFYEHFDLFNWIHAEIDAKQIMLRLIGITFDFSSIEKIEVEFSEQVRNANGITDLESILGQAKSMATSYSSTLKQAQNGQEACLEFDTIKQEGLNSALMNIKNSNNEEVVIDNCGINCRSKDQNDQYDQCQLRITGKNIVMTDDDWRTASMAIGAGLFNGQECYGVWCDVLCGNFVVSEALLIANSSGTFLVDKDGIIVERMKLDMSNADGSRRIVIDPELDSILSVYTNSKQVFYVDINGNMCMLGNLYVNNNNMYLKVDMTAENIIEVGYGEITGTGNEGEAGSGEGSGVNTGNYVKQMWEQVDYGQDIYNGTVPIIKAGLDSNIAIFNGATVFKQQCFLNYGGEIYHLVHGGYLTKYNEKQKSWNLVTKIENQYVTDAYHSSLVKTDKEDGNIYIFFTGYSSGSSYYNKWGVLLKYNLETSALSEVWTNGLCSPYTSKYNYGRHYIKGDTFYIADGIDGVNAPFKVTLNSDRSYSSGGQTQWAPQLTKIHEIIPYNGNEYAVISIGQSKVMLIKFKSIDAFTYDTLYTFDYTMSSNLRTGGIIADIFNDKIVVVFKHMSVHYEYDIKTDTMNELKTFKLSLYGTAENPCVEYGGVGVSGFSIIASKDKLHMFALGANQCYGDSYYLQDLLHIPQYYIRHYEYLNDGKIETNKNFEKIASGCNFYMSRQYSFTKIGDTIYNIPTFWGMLSGNTGMNSKTANYTSWNVPIYALDTTSKDSDFQIICNNIGVQIVCLISSNSTSKIYFFAGTDALYLQYYDLETQTVGSVFTDENGNRVACNFSWSLFSYLDENEQILYEMGTDFRRIDLTTNTVLYTISLGMTVHSNVEVINDEFYFVSLTSDRSKTKLYKITKSGALSTVATMQEADDIGSNTGYSIAYYNNKIHMYYAANGVLKRKRYQYSFDTGEVTSYNDMFQDNGMYVYDCFWDISTTCHLPAIATSTGIHYFTGTTYDFNNKFKNPFNHYLYTESGVTPTDPEDPDNPTPPSVDNPSDKIFYITNEGDGYFYGTVYAKDGKFSGDIYARNLTLGENAVVSGKITSQTGEIGKWIIAENGLISPDFSEYTTGTSGLALYSDGNILNRGLWNGQDNAWYAYLYKGKWVFGLGNYFGATTDEQYSDISANGIYMCSKHTILNKSSQYLFAVDTTNDTVSITNSSSNSPALTITNNYFSDDNSYDAPALVLHSPKQGYRNRPLDVRMRVTGEILGTGQSVDNEYCMQMFGEQEYGRIIFRSSKIVGTVNDDGTVTYAPEGNTADTESSDPLVPSMIGSSTFRWFQGYFMELYSTNGLNTSSDKKIKNHIQDIDANKSLELINSLTPVEYTLKNNANNRKHMGFYAQDVKKACDDMELGNMSLYAATWHKDGQEQECYYSEDAPDEELQWTLKYEEFIAPLVGAVQALTKRVEDLEAENEKLKEETNNG